MHVFDSIVHGNTATRTGVIDKAENLRLYMYPEKIVELQLIEKAS
jgi:hypothetical protein